jgi:hypothetical protein
MKEARPLRRAFSLRGQWEAKARAKLEGLGNDAPWHQSVEGNGWQPPRPYPSTNKGPALWCDHTMLFAARHSSPARVDGLAGTGQRAGLTRVYGRLWANRTISHSMTG